MMQKLELVIFDYDGTLTRGDETHIRPDVIAGIQALWGSRIKTTAITARPYRRLEHLSGGTHMFTSSDVPIATDRGSRIVSGDRLTNLEYNPLHPDELQSILALPKDTVDFIGFYPEELHGTSYIWTPQAERTKEIRSSLKDDVTVLEKNQWLLAEALNAAKPCLVTICFNSDTPSNASYITKNLNAEWTGRSVSIITHRIDKQSALSALCKNMKISLEATLYAGNDYNDLPVFAIEELCERLFVGPLIIDGTELCKKIPSPTELGLYFKKIAKERK